MKKISLSLFLIFSFIEAKELNSSMQQYMEELKIEAKKENPAFSEFDYTSGKKIFTTEHIGKRGKLISCVTCHSNNLSNNGININTNKTIEPLSPYTSALRFTSVKEVKKWLKRNFGDVYNRVGTAQEKGDVITYIINKKD